MKVMLCNMAAVFYLRKSVVSNYANKGEGHATYIGSTHVRRKSTRHRGS